MPNTLRSKLIRLAHSNPALRGDLLPLLRTAAGSQWEKDYLHPAMRRYCGEVAATTITALGGYGKALPDGDGAKVLIPGEGGEWTLRVAVNPFSGHLTYSLEDPRGREVASFSGQGLNISRKGTVQVASALAKVVNDNMEVWWRT